MKNDFILIGLSFCLCVLSLSLSLFSTNVKKTDTSLCSREEMAIWHARTHARTDGRTHTHTHTHKHRPSTHKHIHTFRPTHTLARVLAGTHADARAYKGQTWKHSLTHSHIRPTAFNKHCMCAQTHTHSQDIARRACALRTHSHMIIIIPTRTRRK